jgi:Bacterial protein of unknown function (DUF882)
MHGMSGSRPSFAAFSVSALAILLAPSMASASTHSEKVHRTARADSHTCAKPAVEFVAGPESATFSLERCDGDAIPGSIDKLSILARPVGTAKPKDVTAKGAEVAPGVRRLDARIAERLELVADHFRKDGAPTRIEIVAPKSRSAGSYHASGRAIDFRIEGADNDAVASFCKTVQDTGCGFYPNGGFVHMDVRDAGAGHVSWIDVSKAGEAPKYVSAWPLPDTAKSEPKTETAKVESKTETAKNEPAKSEPTKCEAPKSEPAKDETAKNELPSLPAAVQVAPMEESSPKATEVAPVKKHRHHRKSHSSHTI